MQIYFCYHIVSAAQHFLCASHKRIKNRTCIDKSRLGKYGVNNADNNEKKTVFHVPMYMKIIAIVNICFHLNFTFQPFNHQSVAQVIRSFFFSLFISLTNYFIDYVKIQIYYLFQYVFFFGGFCNEIN